MLLSSLDFEGSWPSENKQDASPKSFCCGQVLNKAQLAKVQTAAKELRKVYCKKVMEKLCILMKATLKQLAKHFQVILVAFLVTHLSRRRLLRAGQRWSWRTTGRSTARATSSLSWRPSSGESFLFHPHFNLPACRTLRCDLLWRRCRRCFARCCHLIYDKINILDMKMCRSGRPSSRSAKVSPSGRTWESKPSRRCSKRWSRSWQRR